MHRAFASSLLLGLALVLAGCGSSASDSGSQTGTNPIAVGAEVPDFHLVDVNPASPRAGRIVSPRDYQGQVSAWYFGHST